MIDAIADFGTAVGDSVGKDYRVSNPRVEKYLRDYMTARVDLINSTTRKQLQEALKADDPKAAVRKVFAHARDARAKTIATSESVRASNFAAIDSGKWNADLAFKTWISQRDQAVRHTHEELDGQTVGWLEDFTSISGAHGPYPGALGRPEEDISCRCFPAPTGRNIQRELTNGQALQEFADKLRGPSEAALEQAWRDVFAEQEAAVLAELG